MHFNSSQTVGTAIFKMSHKIISENESNLSSMGDSESLTCHQMLLLLLRWTATASKSQVTSESDATGSVPGRDVKCIQRSIDVRLGDSKLLLVQNKKVDYSAHVMPLIENFYDRFYVLDDKHNRLYGD